MKNPQTIPKSLYIGALLGFSRFKFIGGTKMVDVGIVAIGGAAFLAVMWVFSYIGNNPSFTVAYNLGVVVTLLALGYKVAYSAGKFEGETRERFNSIDQRLNDIGTRIGNIERKI